MSDTRWPDPGVRDGRALSPPPEGALRDVLARAGAEMAALQHRLAAAEETVTQLGVAVRTNRRIGMALGILMALRKLTEEQAFDLLREASNLRNTKLREIAEDVIRTGTLD